GLLTEYSRKDREDYVIIKKDNINPKYESYFYLNNDTNASTYGTPYDYGSILHDDSKAFSGNNKDTLEVKKPEHKEFYQKMLGQRYRTGFYDYKLINEHYCNDECSKEEKKPECWWNGYQNPNKCGECLCPFPLLGHNCRNILPNNSPQTNNYYYVNEVGIRFGFLGAINCHIFLETSNPKRIRLTWHKINLYDYTPCGPKTDAIEVKYKADKGLTGLCFCGYMDKPYTIDSEDKLLIFIYLGYYDYNHIDFDVKAIS
uniref:Metalloendopeptidase n=1 Tax=Parastrongyloides trichosuri TaxID=131310 RepID=A0A0N4ZKY6_PARTI